MKDDVRVGKKCRSQMEKYLRGLHVVHIYLRLEIFT